MPVPVVFDVIWLDRAETVSVIPVVDPDIEVLIVSFVVNAPALCIMVTVAFSVDFDKCVVPADHVVVLVDGFVDCVVLTSEVANDNSADTDVGGKLLCLDSNAVVADFVATGIVVVVSDIVKGSFVVSVLFIVVQLIILSVVVCTGVVDVAVVVASVS